MEILINDYPIDFDLEGQNTPQEIASSISAWAKERGLIFLELFINDKLYSLDEISGREFKNVDLINCVIESKSNLVFSTVDEGAFYCNKVVNFINSIKDNPVIDRKDLDNLVSGIEWLIDVLDNIAGLMDLNVNVFKYRDKKFHDFTESLKKTVEELQGLSGEKDIADCLSRNKTFFVDLKELFRMIIQSNEMKELIMKSIDSPDILISTLHSLKEELPIVIKNIEESAISFQTGKDGAGMEKLNEYIDFMLMYTRICYQVVPVFGINPMDIKKGEVSLEEKNSLIMELLNDVIAAMENSDVVSLADILEYEIMPLTGDLDYYIDSLINKIDRK